MRVRTCVAVVALMLVGGCSDLGEDPFPNAIDAGTPDGRVDAAIPDARPDGGGDAGAVDAASPDAKPVDGGGFDGSGADVTSGDAAVLDATAANDKFEAMPSFTRHVFICVNERPPGNPKGCCKEKGGDKVRDLFKKRLAEAGLHGVVRANKSGCLDECEAGVAVVVYPEQVWYGGVTEDDVQEIVDTHIIGGTFVERLMLPAQPHLGDASSGPAIAARPPDRSDEPA